MIAKFAKSTADFFVQKQVISKIDEEIYAYGMELLYSALFNITIAVIIAIARNIIFPMTIFLTIFIILRQYIGGYHAKTHFGCMLITTIVSCCFAILAKFIHEEFEIYTALVATITSVMIILKFSPAEHPNKPLSENEKLRLRKRGSIEMAFSYNPFTKEVELL